MLIRYTNMCKKSNDYWRNNGINFEFLVKDNRFIKVKCLLNTYYD